MHHYNAPLTN